MVLKTIFNFVQKSLLSKFSRISGVNYNLHQPKTINPISLTEFIEAWEQDYKTMQEQMIYGDSPSFEEIINTIKTLVKKLNSLDWEIAGNFKK